MRKIWIILLLILIVIPLTYGAVPSAEVEVLDLAQMQEVSIKVGSISLDIEFEVENTGYEKVLILLPFSTRHPDMIDSAKGEAILTKSQNRRALWDKYGDPERTDSFRNQHFVRTEESPVTRGASMNYTGLGASGRGWYIYPNELLKGHIKFTSTESGIIDPFSIEDDLPYIEVTKFYITIRFEPEFNSYGFITAPYVVKDAALVSSYPGIFADANDFDPSEYYWEKVKLPETEETREIDVVEWDEWFTTSSVPLTPTLLASTDLEYLPIEEVEKTVEEEEIFVPIWYVQPGADFVSYIYQFRKNFDISGVELDYLKEPAYVVGPIPEWYDWF